MAQKPRGSAKSFNKNMNVQLAPITLIDSAATLTFGSPAPNALVQFAAFILCHIEIMK
jgi:hypothetical protein